MSFKRPDRIYLNLSASASSTSYSLSDDPEAVYTPTSRSEPIVSNIADYKLSVVRAVLQGTSNFPIWIPAIELNQPDPTKTVYQFTLTVYFPVGTITIPNYQIVAPNTSGGVSSFSVAIWESRNSGLDAIVYSYPSPAVVTGSSTTSNSTQYATTLMNSIRALSASTNHYLDSFFLGTGGYPGLPTPRPTQLAMFWPSPIGLPAPDRYYYLVITAADLFSAQQVGFDPTSKTSSLIENIPILLLNDCAYTNTTVTPSPAGTFTTTQALYWTPQNTNIRPPSTPFSVQPETQYYWMYDYAWFVRIMNTTLDAAVTDITTQATTAGVAIPEAWGSGSFSFRYAPSSQSFLLTLPATWTFDDPLTPSGNFPSVSFTLNEILLNLLSWPAALFVNGDGKIIWDNGTLTNNGNSLVLTSDYAAVGSGWSPVGSLVFQSTFFPIRSEILSAPQSYGTQSYTDTSTNDQAQILTDVFPNFNDAADWNAVPIIYTPTVLRWVDLPAGSGSLDRVDFRLGWRNAITGTIIPVTLNPLASFSVKLLLILKDLQA